MSQVITMPEAAYAEVARGPFPAGLEPCDPMFTPDLLATIRVSFDSLDGTMEPMP